MHHTCLACRPLTRRTVFALGAGALAAGAARATPADDHHCDYLLLTCMDFRLLDDIAVYMNGRGLQQDYDHVALAGASLGALTPKRPDWGPTFWQHLDAAIGLHKVKQVMVIDHWNCGAYELFLGEEAVNTPEKEYAEHVRHLRRLRALIRNRYPKHGVELGLMNLKGKVETIA